jgi:hypothetical protein
MITRRGFLASFAAISVGFISFFVFGRRSSSNENSVDFSIPTKQKSAESDTSKIVSIHSLDTIPRPTSSHMFAFLKTGEIVKWGAQAPYDIPVIQNGWLALQLYDNWGAGITHNHEFISFGNAPCEYWPYELTEPNIVDFVITNARSLGSYFTATMLCLTAEQTVLALRISGNNAYYISRETDDFATFRKKSYDFTANIQTKLSRYDGKIISIACKINHDNAVYFLTSDKELVQLREGEISGTAKGVTKLVPANSQDDPIVAIIETSWVSYYSLPDKEQLVEDKLTRFSLENFDMNQSISQNGDFAHRFILPRFGDNYRSFLNGEYKDIKNAVYINANGKIVVNQTARFTAFQQYVMRLRNIKKFAILYTEQEYKTASLSKTIRTTIVTLDKLGKLSSHDSWNELFRLDEAATYTDLAAGKNHVLAIESGTQTIHAYGDNSYGQLLVPEKLGRTVSIAAVSDSSFAIDVDGNLWIWGNHSLANSLAPLLLPGKVLHFSHLDSINSDNTQVVILCDSGDVFTFSAIDTVPINRAVFPTIDSEPRITQLLKLNNQDGNAFAVLYNDGSVKKWGYAEAYLNPDLRTNADGSTLIKTIRVWVNINGVVVRQLENKSLQIEGSNRPTCFDEIQDSVDVYINEEEVFILRENGDLIHCFINDPYDVPKILM